MDKKELVEDTLDHFNYLKQERSDFEGDWLESENLVAPVLKGFNRTTKRPDRPVRFLPVRLFTLNSLFPALSDIRSPNPCLVKTWAGK